MFYVYILRSQRYPGRHYTGFTKEISKRLLKHNYGEVKSTARYKPWKVETLISFDSQDKVISFEKYLKSHSGRAFASKHF
ncbi:MAG: GIY-YIG nuclease family protein [Candidatus Marinimicrobia bacterium]|nr:GIY-YIG nuclease family protein [Candidatus Neomarinimicrobiota bacterium]